VLVLQLLQVDNAPTDLFLELVVALFRLSHLLLEHPLFAFARRDLVFKVLNTCYDILELVFQLGARLIQRSDLMLQ